MAVPTQQELLDANLLAQKRAIDQLYALLPGLADVSQIDKLVDSTEASQGMKNSQRITLLLDTIKALRAQEIEIRKGLLAASGAYSVNTEFALHTNEIGKDESEYADGEYADEGGS